MKKALLILMVLILLAFSALAQTLKLKDVPDDHWAASAVYDLVKMGITKGYPDGTFRGGKPITRYETAIFLSKLAKAIAGEDIKTDIKSLKDQVLELKKETAKGKSLFSGNYLSSWKAGNLLAARGNSSGAVGSYRLILSSHQGIGDAASVKINLDTMDYGYFDDGSATKVGRGLLASELLDVESNLKLDLARPVDLKITYGPGPKQHTTDPTGVMTSEVGVTYVRPNTGIQISTKLSGADISLGYFSLQGPSFDMSGKVNTSQLTGSVALNLPIFKVALTGDYISHGLFSSDSRDLRAKVDLTAPLGEKIEAQGTVGLGGKEKSSMMVSGSLALNDLWDTGTVAIIRMAKIGASYIDPAFANEEFYFAGYDSFNRPLVGGTVQLGGVLTQAVSDKVKIIGKGDMRLSGDYKYEGANARLTAEGGISYNIAPNANLDAAYRVNQDKGAGDTTDVAALGLLYRF